jgi:hypothetical protein
LVISLGERALLLAQDPAYQGGEDSLQEAATEQLNIVRKEDIAVFAQ